MMNENKNINHSDVSFSSSWTIIDEFGAVSRNNLLNNIPNQNHCLSDRRKLLQRSLTRLDEESAMTKNKDNKKIFPMELLKDTESSNRKKYNLNKKKSAGSYHVNFLTIVACLLTITSLTLLTTYLPLKFEKSTNHDYLEKHLIEKYADIETTTVRNAENNIEATLDAIEKSRSMNVSNIISRNVSKDIVSRATFSNSYNNLLIPEESSEMKIRITRPYARNLRDSSLPDTNDKQENVSKFVVRKTKELVENRHLQLFVITLIQDFCLIKFINEFTGKASANIPLQKQTKIPIKKCSRFGKKARKVIKKKNKPMKRETHLVGMNQEQSVSTQLSPKKNVVKKDIEKSIEEDGKSGCERRFEEMDERWPNLRQNEQKVDQIKSKFQKEVTHFKQIKKQCLSRNQNMLVIREKFIEKLKDYRHNYLQQLRRIHKDNKRETLGLPEKELKTQKVSPIDVLEGNLAVISSSNLAFTGNYNILKSKKQQVEAPELENNHEVLISGLPPDLHESKMDENHNWKNSENYIGNFENSYRVPNDRKKKKIGKLYAGNQSDHGREQSVTSNLLEFSSENISLTQEGTLLPEKIQNSQSSQPSGRKKHCEKNIRYLYDAVFEERSKIIQQDDRRKWSRKYGVSKWIKPPKLMSKQDPFFTYKNVKINLIS